MAIGYPFNQINNPILSLASLISLAFISLNLPSEYYRCIFKLAFITHVSEPRWQFIGFKSFYAGLQFFEIDFLRWLTLCTLVS